MTLTETGMYTVLLDPDGSNVGTMTVKLYDVPPDITGTITPGGDPVTATTTGVGQNARLTFSGTAGQRVALKPSSTMPGYNYTRLLRPDGSQMSSSYNSNFMDTVTLAVAGTYTIVLDPDGMNVGAMTVKLYDVPPDVTGTITPGGGPVSVSIPSVGQNARLTFQGTAGQRVLLQPSAITMSSRAWHKILKPDGGTLSSTYNDNIHDTKALPLTGTYTILVDPEALGTGDITLKLYDVPPDVTGPIMPGGDPITVAIPNVGQSARLSFDGVQGQRVAMMPSGIAATSTVWHKILKPDGGTLSSTYSNNFHDTKTLPVTGTYTVLLDPDGMGTGSITLTLFDVPPDTTGSIAIGGPAVTVTTTGVGQNGRLTFQGSAGQQVTVRPSTSMPGLNWTSVLQPDGEKIASHYNNNQFSATLPVAEIYTILVDPAGLNLGSMSVTLTSP